MVGFGLRLLEIRGLKVCLRVFWTRSVRPVGETGQTGQSGFELPDRSDRSSAPVRPVCVCCAAIREVSLALLPRCYLGLLLRDSLSIAILADLGSRACGDFGI